MVTFVLLVVGLTLAIVVNVGQATICIVGQEPDTNSPSRYRWVTPEKEPWLCTSFLQGGLSTIVPRRPFDFEDIRHCTVYADCSEVQAQSVNGVPGSTYMIQPSDSGRPIKVYCDMETDGGGWTVFQRRRDGSVDFYRTFNEYRDGFGDLEGEFWLGNENLHRLTSQGEYELLVELRSENETPFATYDKFRVGDETTLYKLYVHGFVANSTAGDSLTYHNDSPFSAKDRDNDLSSILCAKMFKSGWWFRNCFLSNLNGVYDTSGIATGVGIKWNTWGEYYNTLQGSEMKFRIKTSIQFEKPTGN